MRGRWWKQLLPPSLYKVQGAAADNCFVNSNALYYGDNLDVLRRYIEDSTIDLVYLDPPFNSNQDYNILFAEQDGSRSAAQIKAFGDSWRWDQAV